MNTDPYLATKDIEERKRLCAEHMLAHLNADDIKRKTYYKISSLWCWRAVETFGTWGLAQKEVFPYAKRRHRTRWGSGHKKSIDIFTTTTNIEERKKLVIDNMRANLDPHDLRYTTYREISQIWSSRAITVFGKWESAKQEAFPGIEQQRNHNIRQVIPYTNKSKSMPSKRSKLFLKVKKAVEKLLQSIEIIEEKKWPKWLFYKNSLSIDMFLPFFNLAIEVDGKQHYYKNSFLNQSNHDTFKDRQMRDKIKNAELPKHNITLIRIKYNEVKRIPEILKYYVDLLKTIQEYCAY